MIVDLNPMRYTHATELIRWCIEHDVDREKCMTLIEAMLKVPSTWDKDLEWTIDIPEKYITYFLLKWSGQES